MLFGSSAGVIFQLYGFAGISRMYSLLLSVDINEIINI